MIAQQKQELQNMPLPECLKVVGLSTAPAQKATAIKADYLNIRSDCRAYRVGRKTPSCALLLLLKLWHEVMRQHVDTKGTAYSL